MKFCVACRVYLSHQSKVLSEKVGASPGTLAGRGPGAAEQGEGRQRGPCGSGPVCVFGDGVSTSYRASRTVTRPLPCLNARERPVRVNRARAPWLRAVRTFCVGPWTPSVGNFCTRRVSRAVSRLRGGGSNGFVTQDKPLCSVCRVCSVTCCFLPVRVRTCACESDPVAVSDTCRGRPLAEEQGPSLLSRLRAPSFATPSASHCVSAPPGHCGFWSRACSGRRFRSPCVSLPACCAFGRVCHLHVVRFSCVCCVLWIVSRACRVWSVCCVCHTRVLSFFLVCVSCQGWSHTVVYLRFRSAASVAVCYRRLRACGCLSRLRVTRHSAVSLVRCWLTAAFRRHQASRVLVSLDPVSRAGWGRGGGCLRGAGCLAPPRTLGPAQPWEPVGGSRRQAGHDAPVAAPSPPHPLRPSSCCVTCCSS